MDGELIVFNSGGALLEVHPTSGVARHLGPNAVDCIEGIECCGHPDSLAAKLDEPGHMPMVTGGAASPVLLPV